MGQSYRQKDFRKECNYDTICRTLLALCPSCLWIFNAILGKQTINERLKNNIRNKMDLLFIHRY